MVFTHTIAVNRKDLLDCLVYLSNISYQYNLYYETRISFFKYKYMKFFTRLACNINITFKYTNYDVTLHNLIDSYEKILY